MQIRRASKVEVPGVSEKPFSYYSNYRETEGVHVNETTTVKNRTSGRDHEQYTLSLHSLVS